MSRDWKRQIIVEDRYLEATSLLRDLEESISWLTKRDEWETLKEEVHWKIYN